MRITGGTFRGRKLIPPAGREIRPTSDKVREAIFGILAAKIVGAGFLDCFAGTGAMGIEAISRGASTVTMVEKNRKAVMLIHSNLKNLNADATVLTIDFFKAVEKLKTKDITFDLIFIDPPYQSLLQEQAVLSIEVSGLIEIDGTVIVEHEKHLQLPLNIGGLEQIDHRKYGETVLTFYQYSGRK